MNHIQFIVPSGERYNIEEIRPLPIRGGRNRTYKNKKI